MVSVEIANTTSLQSLLRAAVLFKFEGGDSAVTYMGSPYYADALRSILESVIRESPNGDDWRDTYHLTKHKERLSSVTSYAARHPRWDSLETAQRKDWIATVSAPYWYTEEEGLELIGSVELARRRGQ